MLFGRLVLLAKLLGGPRLLKRFWLVGVSAPLIPFRRRTLAGLLPAHETFENPQARIAVGGTKEVKVVEEVVELVDGEAFGASGR